MERQVADDDMRGMRQSVAQKVRSHDTCRAGSARGETLGPPPVHFDGRERASKTLQRHRQCAIARADFDDGPMGARHDTDDGVDDAVISKEILAVLMTALMRGRHDNSAARWGSSLR